MDTTWWLALAPALFGLGWFCTFIFWVDGDWISKDDWTIDQHVLVWCIYLVWFCILFGLVDIYIWSWYWSRWTPGELAGLTLAAASPPPPLPLSARHSWYLDLRLNEIRICWENHPHFFRFWTSEKVVALYSNLTRKIQWAVASFSKISAFFSNLCLLANGKVLSGDICMLRSTKNWKTMFLSKWLP